MAFSHWRACHHQHGNRHAAPHPQRWHTVAADLKPLKEPPTIGRALTADEKTALLETAALKPEWETAYFGAVLALKTTMRGCEIKGLKWRDVDLLNDTIAVEASKTDAGERVIPMTPEAFETFVKLRTRAELFGEVLPSHYVFAAYKPVGRFNGNGKELQEIRMVGFDPTTPLGSWKKAWSKLTTKAGLPGLRFHDLRHTAITNLLTNPRVSVQTTKAIAGHVSQRMVDRYAHIHTEAQRSAVLEGLSGQSNVTNNVTRSPEVVESIGRRVGI